MLELIDLKVRASKEGYRRDLEALQSRLFELQRACWQARLSAIVVVEGWHGSGKGSLVAKVTERLEPRGFRLYNTTSPRTSETMMPWLWRFWQRLPRYGLMGIFEQSWYREVLAGGLDRPRPERERRRLFVDINDFERMLHDDRYEIMKIFLHISKKLQKKRLKALKDDPVKGWRFRDEDLERYRHYDDLRILTEETLRETQTEWGPWEIVAAHDKRWARLRVLETLVQGLEKALTRRGHPVPPVLEPGALAAEGGEV